MTESKHTPGPWIRFKRSKKIFGKDKIIIADCGLGRKGAIGEANACLIAAAPELLEACKDFLDIVNESNGIIGWHLNGDVLRWNQCEQIQMMIDAIAKAEGEQS